jgi:hypothetical protein
MKLKGARVALFFNQGKIMQSAEEGSKMNAVDQFCPGIQMGL